MPLLTISNKAISNKAISIIKVHMDSNILQKLSTVYRVGRYLVPLYKTGTSSQYIHGNPLANHIKW